jgi:hypothetical protein
MATTVILKSSTVPGFFDIQQTLAPSTPNGVYYTASNTEYVDINMISISGGGTSVITIVTPDESVVMFTYSTVGTPTYYNVGTMIRIPPGCKLKMVNSSGVANTVNILGTSFTKS